MALIGYARVSTEDQSTEPQALALREAGCTTILTEHASGAARARPVLTQALDRIRPGDVLIVVRLDRLARSLSHLLRVIDRLEARGAHFCSLGDPVDTTSPQGKFTLQVLAAAELERTLIRERTVAGLKSARARGRVGGNPGLRARDPQTIRKVALSRDDAYMRRLIAGAEEWVPLVRRMRPQTPWEDVARSINAALPPGRSHWSGPRLVRAVRRYVREGMLEPHLMNRAPSLPPDDRLLAIIAGIKGAGPSLTLRQICDRLEAMHERTPRGRTKWQPSSVAMLIERAGAQGML